MQWIERAEQDLYLLASLLALAARVVDLLVYRGFNFRFGRDALIWLYRNAKCDRQNTNHY